MAATATVRAVKGRLLPSRAALVLTQSAVQRVKTLLLGNPEAIGLRVGVRQRGCNGMSYTLDYTTEKKKFDEVVTQDGVTVIVDAKAQMSLRARRWTSSRPNCRRSSCSTTPTSKEPAAVERASPCERVVRVNIGLEKPCRRAALMIYRREIQTEILAQLLIQFSI